MYEVMKNLQVDVSAKLAASGEAVRQSVIDVLVAKELEIRKVAVLSAMTEVESLSRNLMKIKPKPAGFDESGNPVGGSVYTAEQVAERKKLTDQIDRFQSALTKAFEKGDWSTLKDLTKTVKAEQVN